jgi:hypothetical protein
MNSGPILPANKLAKNQTKVTFIPDQHVIQTFPTQRPDRVFSAWHTTPTPLPPSFSLT